MQLRTRLLKLLRKKSYSPSTIENIYKQLEESHLQLKQLQKALLILEGEDKVIKSGNKYIAATKGPDLVRGRFQANTRGFGFVIAPAGDIYIRSDKVNHALNGDLVEARITGKRRRESTEGYIIKVLARSFDEIIGRVEEKGEQKWLIPSDRRLQNIFLLEKGAQAKSGQMVVASIVKYPPKGLARVKEVLGDEHSPEIEIEVIIREHKLRFEWPDEVNTQAEKLPQSVKEADLKGRKDYRSEYVVTIDGLDAKDFDDAVSVKRLDGKFHLTVHIADVCTYVKEGTPLDEEAKARGNSTYLSDRVLPMFPFRLSNEMASLNPNVDRLTLSVEMIINDKGEVESFSIHEGVIKSKARLTYEEVDASIKSKKFTDENQKNMIEILIELQKILEKKREKTGSLIFESIEPKVIIDDEQNPIDIIVRERSQATSIIEEMMILTNQVVARHMSKRRYPIIYRLHEEPAEDALNEIEGMLASFNYPAAELKAPDSKTYQSVIKFAHNRPDKLLINSVLIRSMQKARYSATEKYHFGLGLKFYCHFTSPIRRYADLVVHRQVKKMLINEYDFNKEELSGQLNEIAANISMTEVESAVAERETKDVMIARYMEDKVGETFGAIITGITNFGLFVQIPNSAEGLVHITSLRDDYYVFEPDRYLVRGRRTGKFFRLGQKVTVELIKVTIGERQLDFEIVDGK